jgi:hypothetical protein
VTRRRPWRYRQSHGVGIGHSPFAAKITRSITHSRSKAVRTRTHRWQPGSRMVGIQQREALSIVLACWQWLGAQGRSHRTRGPPVRDAVETTTSPVCIASRAYRLKSVRSSTVRTDLIGAVSSTSAACSGVNQSQRLGFCHSDRSGNEHRLWKFLQSKMGRCLFLRQSLVETLDLPRQRYDARCVRPSGRPVSFVFTLSPSPVWRARYAPSHVANASPPTDRCVAGYSTRTPGCCRTHARG